LLRRGASRNDSVFIGYARALTMKTTPIAPKITAAT
jgi:hypothetical protein